MASPFKEAIESPHKNEFFDAMMKEIKINNHTEKALDMLQEVFSSLLSDPQMRMSI